MSDWKKQFEEDGYLFNQQSDGSFIAIKKDIIAFIEGVEEDAYEKAAKLVEDHYGVDRGESVLAIGIADEIRKL